VQDRQIEGLKVEFRIDRTLASTPNTADVTVYNLSQENRQFLQELQKPIVQIRAGYRGEDPTEADSNQPGSTSDATPAVVYLGQMREVTNLREGPHWLTRMTTGDGDEGLSQPVKFSLGPGIDVKNVVKKMIEDAGLGIGNAVDALKKGKFQEAGTQFINGFVGSGASTRQELERLMNSAGLEYSIQNGSVQAVPIGSPLNNQAVLLSPESGLVGSPELGTAKESKKPQVKFRSLLNAKIVPGALIRVTSASIDSFFRVQRVVYLGDTHGQDWYVDGEAIGI
jgi:hypothetical protein